ARHGNASTGAILLGPSLLQAAVSPIRIAGRVRGVLVLASACDDTLARRIRNLTRAEITIVARGAALASTLERPEERRDAALLAGGLAGQRIVLPLRGLVDAAAAMEQGDYERPIGVRRRDEIGVLAVSFEAMRGHQKERVEALRDLTRLRSEFIAMTARELEPT